MEVKIKQCIHNIVGVFCLMLGTIKVIRIILLRYIPMMQSQIYNNDRLVSLFLKILPGLILIIISITLIAITKKANNARLEKSQLISEESKTDKTLKVIEGSTIGLLLIMHNGYNLIVEICSQISSLINYKGASSDILSDSVLSEIYLDSLLTNIPIFVLYIAMIIIGVVLISKTKKKYSINTFTSYQPIKQRINKIVGLFFLIIGNISLISPIASIFTASLAVPKQFSSEDLFMWEAIIPKAIPSLIIITISLFLLVIAKKKSKLENEDCIAFKESISSKMVSVIKNSIIGLLLIIYSGFFLLSYACNEIIMYISTQGSTYIQIIETEKIMLLTNSPTLILYIAALIVGVCLLIKTKKKYNMWKTY